MSVKLLSHVNEWIRKPKHLFGTGRLAHLKSSLLTRQIACAQFAASRTVHGALVSVAGGGDTVAALNHAGVGHEFSYVSTAGGAFLEWMEDDTPGVIALEN